MIDDKQAFWKSIRKPLVIAAFAVLLYEIFENFSSVRQSIRSFLTLLEPVTYGLFIAFVVNMPLKFLERHTRKGKSRISKKLRRPLCLVCAYLFIILIVICLIAIITPKIAESIKTFASNFAAYQESLDELVQDLWKKLNLTDGVTDWLINQWNAFIAYTQRLAGEILPKLFQFTISIAAGIYNMMLSLIISVFVLYNKEKFIRQAKRVVKALFPRRAAAIIEIGAYTSQITGKFIMGQIVIALILGLLCFLGMTIIGLPYAVLFSVIIGFTSIVPIIGPLIGTIPCAFIILMIEPVKALWFVIFIIVLHQLEGDLIYPRVVGNAIGLSGFWVLLAVVLGGGLFGLPGVLFGVPFTAVLYELAKRWVKQREIKNMELKKPKADKT